MDIDIKGLLEKEKTSGYMDSAAFGGFAAFIADWAQQHNLPKLQQAAEKYSTISLQDRPELLEEMRDIISGLETDTHIESAKSPFPHRQEKNIAQILSSPLTTMKNIGEKRAALFRKQGAKTIGELLEMYPRDYQDRRKITPISQLRIGETANISGKIIATDVQRVNRGKMTILRCYLKDDTGIIPAVWFNQPFLKNKFYEGRDLIVYGNVEVRRRNSGLEIHATDYQTADQPGQISMGILPVYRSSEGLSQKTIRSTIQDAWDMCDGDLPDTIPQELRLRHNLMHRAEAIKAMHFPKEMEEIITGRISLSYEELLCIQLAILRNRPADESRIDRTTHISDDEVMEKYLEALPFSPTAAQLRVISEIFADMNKPYPMSRLLQGDVGSGKTAVAAAAIAKCCFSGKQAAMMAPTELLATQHFNSLAPLLDKLGISNILLTSSTGKGQKNKIYDALASGSLMFVVGTHALIQDSVQFADLGLAITDEQHRFGVTQRAKLRGASATDTLTMTATPIPRTLAMTLYADMSMSIIDELPPGRKPVRTYAVDYSYEERIHIFMRKEIAKGRQVFVVCPLIEDSEDTDMASVTGHYQRLQKDIFPELHIGLLHGKMKSEEKSKVMQQFKDKQIHILVATTVVEVGIDIPNASIMLVRDAERFGLAQLHQLRGRIGRGQYEGHCILMHNHLSQIAKERMDILCKSSDGFELAEADLKLRGPGEFFGKRQHGLPSLQVADIFRDHDLLAKAHEDALDIIAGKISDTENLDLAVKEKLALLSGI